MTTDLTKILSASGQNGLFRYVAPTRSGVIVEALSDGKRTVLAASSKITSLSDISIYTDDGEMKLQAVFEALHTSLGDEAAPSSKADADTLKALFAKAVPNYDGTRFYVSHMKKVVDWYNNLKNFASLEFAKEEEPVEEQKA